MTSGFGIAARAISWRISSSPWRGRPAFKAYAMSVTRRDRSFFFESYLSTSQLDDTLAIVTLDGKEEMFDPGTHLCPYHELAWQHQSAQGLRQVDGGSSIAQTINAPYTASHVTRLADLALDEHGIATGTITLSYSGVACVALAAEVRLGG